MLCQLLIAWISVIFSRWVFVILKYVITIVFFLNYWYKSFLESLFIWITYSKFCFQVFIKLTFLHFEETKSTWIKLSVSVIRTDLSVVFLLTVIIEKSVISCFLEIFGSLSLTSYKITQVFVARKIVCCWLTFSLLRT